MRAAEEIVAWIHPDDKPESAAQTRAAHECALIIDRETAGLRERNLELLTHLKAVEAKLTLAAQAFYVSGKPSELRAALTGWQDVAKPARAAIAKATKPAAEAHPANQSASAAVRASYDAAHVNASEVR